jgi:hypothetical protein
MLVPLFAGLALVAVGATPFVGPFALAVLLVALAVWGLWKAAANILALLGENVFRRAGTSELLGVGGQDDPDSMLVPRRSDGGEEGSDSS